MMEEKSTRVETLHDRFGRRLLYLRFSLTEACNMSCTYCLPEGFPEWYRHKARLSLPQIHNVLKAFREMGFEKVRFTGGEPTAHPDALRAVEVARELGFADIALTTNGTLIRDLSDWQKAGLTQINVSLDSLNEETFYRQTKSRDLKKVLRLIDDAQSLDMLTKINTVLLRSVNLSEAQELMRWAKRRNLTLRFIELMPTGLNQSFYRSEQVLNSELTSLLIAEGFNLDVEEERSRTQGPARIYHHGDLPGRIGLINPLSCNFCDDCNRLRVTARGALKLCLFSKEDQVLPVDDAAAVTARVRALIGLKEERHQLEQGQFGNVETFRVIGG